MKRFLLFLLLSAGAAPLFAQGPATNTADFYLANPDAWLDKDVAVNVAWIDIKDSTALDNGYKTMQAETFSAGHFGGYVRILATPEAAARLVQTCGTQRKTSFRVVAHMIHGVFAKDGDHYALKVDK
jgi:hypothetical protein